MDLKDVRSKPVLFNKNLRLERMKYYHHSFANSYTHDPKFQHVILQLRKRNIENALDELDKMINNGIHIIDAYRLKGDVLHYYTKYLASWEQFDQILKHVQNDKQALLITAFLAHYFKDLDEFQERVKHLKFVSPELVNNLYYYLDYINSNNTVTDVNRFFKENIDFDAIIVYGYRVNNDGSFNNILEKRLKKMKELSIKHPNAHIILLGGPVHNKIHEALSMYDWAIQNDIPSNRITVDSTPLDMARDTQVIIEIVKSLNLKNLCIASDLDHLPRMWLSLTTAVDVAKLDTNVYGDAYPEEEDFEISEIEIRKSYDTTLRSANLFNLSTYK